MLFAPWTSTNSQSRLEVYKFVCWANSGRCAWLVLGTSWDCWWGLVPCLAELQLASTRVTHWRLWTTCRQPNIPDIQPKMPNVSKCIQMYPNVPIPSNPMSTSQDVFKEISILSWEPRSLLIHGVSGPATNGFSFSASTFDSGPRQVPQTWQSQGCSVQVPWRSMKCFKMLQDASRCFKLSRYELRLNSLNLCNTPNRYKSKVCL